MSYHVAHYTVNGRSWRQAHLLTKSGVMLWALAFSINQYVVRATPEAKWKSPASVAWRVHTVDAQIAALAFIFGGVFLQWRAREKAAAHLKTETTNDKTRARP
jgi:hypothetical protein